VAPTPDAIADAFEACPEYSKPGASRLLVSEDVMLDCRTLWALAYAGGAAAENTFILDDGIRAIMPHVQDGGDALAKLVQCTPSGAGGSQARSPRRTELLSTLADVRAAMQANAEKTHTHGKTVFLDARDKREFESGRIPGALNLSAWSVLADSQRFHTPAALRDLCLGAGLPPPTATRAECGIDRIIVYCRAGPRTYLLAAAMLHAGYMPHLLGGSPHTSPHTSADTYPVISLYLNSMMEYLRTPGVAAVSGPFDKPVPLL
jgi:3-mercaptopyruvate sulfurtransferase SseA